MGFITIPVPSAWRTQKRKHGSVWSRSSSTRCLNTPYIDVEEGQTANLGKKMATDIVLAFIDEVERLGYPGGVYANPSWIEDVAERAQVLGGYEYRR